MWSAACTSGAYFQLFSVSSFWGRQEISTLRVSRHYGVASREFMAHFPLMDPIEARADTSVRCLNAHQQFPPPSFSILVCRGSWGKQLRMVTPRGRRVGLEFLPVRFRPGFWNYVRTKTTGKPRNHGKIGRGSRSLGFLEALFASESRAYS